MRDTCTMPTLAHHGEILASFKLFARPMDRAEVLHAPRYDISGSWKNTPGENDPVFMRKFNFSKNAAHIVCGLLATQHARCHKEYYSPRGQAVSTSQMLLAKTIRFFHPKIKLFQKIQLQSLRFTCHSTMPAVTKNMTRRHLSSWRVILFVTAGMLSGK